MRESRSCLRLSMKVATVLMGGAKLWGAPWIRRCEPVYTIVMWRGGALRLERRFLTYTRLGPSASVSGRLRVAAERCSCYRCCFVNPPQERSIAVHTNAIDAVATLLLAVVMLGAPVAGAGRSRCPVGPTCSHGVQPCVPVHLICLCT